MITQQVDTDTFDPLMMFVTIIICHKSILGQKKPLDPVSFIYFESSHLWISNSQLPVLRYILPYVNKQRIGTQIRSTYRFDLVYMLLQVQVTQRNHSGH